MASAILLTILLAARSASPQMTEVQPPVVFESYDQCTLGACQRVCGNYVTNPWCYYIAYCRDSDNACVCQPYCFFHGHKAHIEVEPIDSCEDRVDSCE